MTPLKENLAPPSNNTELFPNCPLCGTSGGYLPMFNRSECGTVVRCQSCSLVYTQRRPSVSFPELRRLQPEPLPEMILKKEDDQADDFQEVLDRLADFQRSGSLLELGCLTGHFLNLARQAGYAVTGLEPDTWVAEYAARTFGLDIRATYVEDLHLADKSVDVIVMLHVLEHFTRPNETLAELHRILKDSGVVVIEIPIVDNLLTNVMGRHHRHYVFDHTLFFSSATFPRMLAKHDFRIERAELTGRTIRLGRLAWSLRRNSAGLGGSLENALRLFGLYDFRVKLNARDILRVYCRKQLPEQA